MKIQKGEAGYINRRKRLYLLAAIGEFAVVAGLFAVGWITTGSRMNLLTIVAVLGCLPASKMLVEFIMMAPRRSVAPEVHREIEEKGSLLTRVYDLVITDKDKVMPIDAAVISGNTILGYAAADKTDTDQAASFIKSIFTQNRIEKVSVKVFHDYKAFITRIEGLNSMRSVDHQNQNSQEHKMKKLLLALSM